MNKWTCSSCLQEYYNDLCEPCLSCIWESRLGVSKKANCVFTLQERFDQMEAQLDQSGITDRFKRWFVQMTFTICSYGAKTDDLYFFYEIYPVETFGEIEIK